jgi:hypothetical protein
MSAVELPQNLPEFWSIGDLQFHCRIGRTRAWELVREAGFPKPVAVGRRLIWPRSEVLEFLEARRRRDYGLTSAAVAVLDGPRFLERPVRRRSP